jgi:murein DD-endopeptidase MepM/ murein hydrolase activator NlpD
VRSTNARLGAHGIAIAVITLLIWVGAATPGAARTTAALQVRAAGAPQRVHGSDGREHVEYDLVVTNVFSADATLTSLQVRGDGRLLLTLTGDVLAAATHRVFSTDPTASIASASTAVTQVDLVLPRALRGATPKRLTHRIAYTIPADAPSRAIIGSTTIDGPVLRIDRRAPIVISSPLGGSGWLNANGCCSDPTSPHRATLVSSSNGAYVTPETFAVDWIRVVGGVFYTGDGKQNSDWPAYGAPVYAVANGTVVSTVDDKPEIPPFENNPDLGRPADYAGNNVILKLGRGRYAAYAHLQPGSVRVRRGQRLRTGQQIGRLGNSGNTDGPHLHFGIQARPDPLSDSVPFEIDAFTLEGNGDRASTPPTVTLIGTPRQVRQAHPLITSVTTLTPGLAAERRR